MALLIARLLHAQDIEPRQFSNVPIDVNFLLAGYAYTRGGLALDPALPITNAALSTSNGLLAYARAIDVWGQSGKVDVVIPYTWLSGTADYRGDTIERVVNGLGDPAFRLSVNFYGSPALTLEEFASYEQDLIIGGSLRVTVPTGQYDDTRIVNIGSNRWLFKPELGVSKAVGPWTLELSGAATFFTDNDNFYNGHRRKQETVFSVQAHVIRSFRSGIWGAIAATYYWGGQAYVDDEASGGAFDNWRYGATLAFPIDRNHSIKAYVSNGISTRTGANYQLVGALWQYRWGGGL